MNNKSKADCDDPQSFEQSFARIEVIVKELEQGTLGLDESLAAYQEAVRHMKYCQNKLREVSRSVELMQAVESDGSYESTPFDDSEIDLQEKAANRSARRSAGAKKTKSDDLFS